MRAKSRRCPSTGHVLTRDVVAPPGSSWSCDSRVGVLEVLTHPAEQVSAPVGTVVVGHSSGDARVVTIVGRVRHPSKAKRTHAGVGRRCLVVGDSFLGLVVLSYQREYFSAKSPVATG